MLLEDLIRHFISDFFPGREIVECIAFRITRNADIELQEDAAADLMVGMEEGEAVKPMIGVASFPVFIGLAYLGLWAAGRREQRG